MERVASGEETLIQIARSFGVSRWLLYKYINAKPERAEVFKAARKASAGARVDQAETIMETAEIDAQNQNHAAVSHAKNQAEFKLKLAAMYDRETYGKPEEKQASGTQIQIGQLFVGALREGSKDLPVIEAKEIPALVSGSVSK